MFGLTGYIVLFFPQARSPFFQSWKLSSFIFRVSLVANCDHIFRTLTPRLTFERVLFPHILVQPVVWIKSIQILYFQVFLVFHHFSFWDNVLAIYQENFWTFSNPILLVSLLFHSNGQGNRPDVRRFRLLRWLNDWPLCASLDLSARALEECDVGL